MHLLDDDQDYNKKNDTMKESIPSLLSLSLSLSLSIYLSINLKILELWTQ